MIPAVVIHPRIPLCLVSGFLSSIYERKEKAYIMTNLNIKFCPLECCYKRGYLGHRTLRALSARNIVLYLKLFRNNLSQEKGKIKKEAITLKKVLVRKQLDKPESNRQPPKSTFSLKKQDAIPVSTPFFSRNPKTNKNEEQNMYMQLLWRKSLTNPYS